MDPSPAKSKDLLTQVQDFASSLLRQEASQGNLLSGLRSFSEAGSLKGRGLFALGSERPHQRAQIILAAYQKRIGAFGGIGIVGFRHIAIDAVKRLAFRTQRLREHRDFAGRTVIIARHFPRRDLIEIGVRGQSHEKRESKKKGGRESHTAILITGG
jgi:hypothetical protein